MMNSVRKQINKERRNGITPSDSWLLAARIGIFDAKILLEDKA